MSELREAGASLLYPPKMQVGEGSHAEGATKLPGAFPFGYFSFRLSSVKQYIPLPDMAG